MHVISGKYKGMKLAYRGPLRPTQQRVRESLFNIIQVDVVGSRFLDLCCGTAAIGIEALSRGAQMVVAVDTHTQLARKNVSTINDNITVVARPIQSYLQSCKDKFDVIFLDPPWDQTQLYDLSLKAIGEFDILLRPGIVVLEHRKGLDAAAFFKSKEVSISEYNYGDTTMTVARYE